MSIAVINYVFDGHCHLAALTADLADIPRAVAAITPTDFESLAGYRQQKPQTKIGFGLHPWFVNKYPDLATLEKLLREQIECLQPDFIGECGLDLLKSDFEYQQAVFELHLRLASEYQLPVVIHCVRAYNQLLMLLAKAQLRVPLLVHAYNGNGELARQLIKKGAYLGVGSIVMNSDSQLLKSITRIPLDNIVIESDAPYMPLPTEQSAKSENCEIYLRELARISMREPDALRLSVNRNWHKIFGNINQD